MLSVLRDLLTIIFMIAIFTLGVFLFKQPNKVHKFYQKYNKTKVENYMQKQMTPFMYKIIAIGIMVFSLIVISLLGYRIIMKE